MELTTFIHGSAHDLHQLADQSVQMIATSPPYYGLRKYQGDQDIEWPEVTFRLNEWVEPTTIPGCDPNCAHEWTDGPVKVSSPQRDHAPDGSFGNGRGTEASRAGMSFSTTQGAYCSRCGGWRGGLGMEPSPVAFIGHLILCLREWRRVLRDDGVCFVNLGDSYAGSGGAGGDYAAGGLKEGQPKYKSPFRPGAGRADGIVDERNQRNRNGLGPVANVKPKDLLGIPWMFAIAARADGWYLRSDIIWAKPNPMPESVTDRPTKAHEYVFLLAKSQRYFWDAEGVREAYSEKTWFYANVMPTKATGQMGNNNGTGKSTLGVKAANENAGRNLRTVWTIATQPTPFAHFATFPEKLVETMIRAGSAVGDTVLDPFNGSGTTAKVAVRLGRAYVGVDISREYLDGVTLERFGAGVQIGMGL